jgi:lysophospholipase L1-like esterase
MKRAAYVAYLLTLLTLALAVVEFIILPRRDWPLPREMQLMGFAAPPNTMVDDTPISAMGFAGDAIEVAKPAGTRRVLMLGASAFFNRRMAERLKERLATASEQPIEVVGAALRSHTTMSSVLKYRVLGRYNFDDVLIYHGMNDLWANLVPPEQFDDDYRHLGCAYHRGILLDCSLLARSVYERFFCHVDPPQFSRVPLHNAAGFASERTFRRNLLTLVEEARSRGARPILITMAWSIPEEYTRERFEAGAVGYHNPDKYDAWGVELWGYPDYVREGMARHNRIVRALSAEMNVSLIDAEAFMTHNPALFGDPCHLNEEGTARLVEHVAQFMTGPR